MQTVDEERRIAIYRQLQQVVARDLPYFWLVETEGFRGYRSAVQGIQIWRSNAFENATLGGN